MQDGHCEAMLENFEMIALEPFLTLFNLTSRNVSPLSIQEARSNIVTGLRTRLPLHAYPQQTDNAQM